MLEQQTLPNSRVRTRTIINPIEVGTNRFENFNTDGINCKKVMELIKLEGRILVISRNTIAINNRNSNDTTILIFLK